MISVPYSTQIDFQICGYKLNLDFVESQIDGCIIAQSCTKLPFSVTTSSVGHRRISKLDSMKKDLLGSIIVQ